MFVSKTVKSITQSTEHETQKQSDTNRRDILGNNTEQKNNNGPVFEVLWKMPIRNQTCQSELLIIDYNLWDSFCKIHRSKFIFFYSIYLCLFIECQFQNNRITKMNSTTS